MRRILLSLSIALLPLTLAQAREAGEQHASLGAHAHGAASLNLALDGRTLEIQLESPAINLLGFEHAPSTAADQAKVAAARSQLEQPASLFSLPAAAGCSLAQMALHSPLFAEQAPSDPHGHADVDVEYRFHCSAPEQLLSLDLAPFFQQFPGTETLNTQLIGPNGQQGAALHKANSRLSF